VSESEAPGASAPDTEKPRPRNWRDFLKEYAVIVVGVLTALAAQQAAEWWRWRSEVAEARIAIAEEIRANGGYFARRLAIAPCINRQVREAHAILDSLEAGKPPPSFTAFRTASGSLLVGSVWESERASQTLTHFPRAELATLSRYYDQLPDYRAWMRDEADVWAQLGLLKSPPAGLGPSDLVRLRGLLGIAERYVNLVELNAGRMLKVGEQLNIAPAPVDPVRVAKFCTGSEDEYRRYLLTTDR